MTAPTDETPPGLSRVQRRLIEPGEQDELSFHHTVFCQTGLPYRDPGDEVRKWEREQGAVSLRIEAGAARHPKTGKWIDLGLPWGTKPRLIMAHLNAEALQQNSQVIEVEGSLSAFVRRIRGFDGGREIRAFKEQLSRLSVATVRLAMTKGDRQFQMNAPLVIAFELWTQRDEAQRVLWPATITLSREYFESLQKHAVPLREADLAALAHSAMALDLYAWLAQRLHRIEPSRPAFVPWEALRQQFGPDYQRMNHFRAEFRVALRQVLARYSAARITLGKEGTALRHSPPPVARRIVQILDPGARAGG